MAQNSSEQTGTNGHHAALPSLSLRARVTLWIVVAFAIVKITLVLLILLYQRRAIHDSFDSVFTDRVAVISADVASYPGPVHDDYLRGIALRETNNIYIQDFAILLYDPSLKQPLASHGRDAGTLRTVAESAKPNSIRGVSYTSATGDNDRSLRIATTAITQPGGQQSLLVIATSDRYTDSVTSAIGSILLFSTPFTIGTIALVAWFVGGIAVRPLEQVRAFAESLRPEDLGRPITFSSTGSEVDALREQLDGAMSRLDAAYQAQARFLANISHEIKTPISVVQSEADVLLLSKPTPEDYLAFVRSTGEEMQRLGKMVESFLMLTRVQQGDSRVRRKPVPMNDLVMSAFEESLGMARQYKVTLEPDLCPDDDAPEVLGNDDLLTTAINNMVRNAIRFSPEGETVSIRCHTDNGYSIVEILDRGPGIPAELLPKLFEPFTQASSERRRGRGTGLGLQIAKGIAELHGGDITVKNLNVGCSFRLVLPLHKPHLAQPTDRMNLNSSSTQP